MDCNLKYNQQRYLIIIKYIYHNIYIYSLGT